MKLVCTQENFRRAIYSTERVVGKQITLPILENILLETEGGMLKIAATNLEIGVFLKIGAKIESQGRITIPAKLLGNFVNNLPAEPTIEIEVVDQTLKIKSGKYSAEIKGLGANDFPIIPEMEGDFIFNLEPQDLKDALTKLLPSTSVDGSRPELSGLNLAFFPSEIHLAATDSFRLAEFVCKVGSQENGHYETFKEKTPSIIVPGTTMAEVLRVISPDTEAIKVAIEESQIFFQVGNVRIVSRLINGKYPEYKQIIPQKFATKAFVEKEDVLRAVKIAGIFAGSKSGEVKIGLFSDGKIVIESRAEDIGSNKTELPIKVEGQDVQLIFNPRYLADGLNAIGSQKLAILANAGDAPAVLRMVDEKENISNNFTYIVMPIKN